MRTTSQVDDATGSTRPAAVAGAGLPLMAGAVCLAGRPGAAEVVAVVFSFMVAASATPAPERLREVRRAAGTRPGDDDPSPVDPDDDADERAEHVGRDAAVAADHAGDPSWFDFDAAEPGTQMRLPVPLATIFKMALIVLLVGAVSLATGAWWVGIAGVPLGMRLCVAEARRRHVLAHP